MGKTNWVILALGLGACLALSLMMKQVLTINEDAKVDPVIKAIAEVFSNRLDGRPEFTVEPRQGRRVGVLTIKPRLNHASRHLANTLGAFAWRQSTPGRFDALQVIAAGRDRPDQKFMVDKPPMMGRFSSAIQRKVPKMPRARPRGAVPGKTGKAGAKPGSRPGRAGPGAKTAEQPPAAPQPGKTK